MTRKPLIAGLASIAAMAAVAWRTPAAAGVPSWVPPSHHSAHQAHDEGAAELKQAPSEHPDDAYGPDAYGPDANGPDGKGPDATGPDANARDGDDVGAPEPARPQVVLHDDGGARLREREKGVSLMEMLGPFALLALLLGAIGLGGAFSGRKRN